ncbi:hypothetical protein [Vibrio sp. SCSIO 43137]|uniref:hypothetical protein n=1 Tax=Vibrio sp. SCSIO 43137 TaxID=3021011 RepID=UPI0023073186|nr:hypothetical protein [Vibrio sp. SCSIO 43137]WCE31119.1 hypothetical protein PK654_07595 [Vibrio sp. SCSIO 43137]
MIYSENRKLSSSSLTRLTDEQKRFIEELQIPSCMHIPSNSEFDTASIDTKSFRWEFSRNGTRHVFLFNLPSKLKNKLLKFLVIQYTDSHSSPLTVPQFTVLRRIIGEMRIDANSWLTELENLAVSGDEYIYFQLKSAAKSLFRIGFPEFDINDYESLEYIKVPYQKNHFLKYQDVENTMPTHLKNLIVKKIAEYSTEEGLVSLSKSELKNITILSLCYSTGMRSAQFSKLKGSSIKKDSENRKTKLKRYRIHVPLAKQQKVTGALQSVALSYEVGRIVDSYKDAFYISNESQMFKDTSGALSRELHTALQAALIFIQNDETKKAIRSGKLLPPTYAVTDFRHNIGHSMAMRGASAEEIAYVLGHSTTVAATHYITATPELAILKHKALGKNPIWQNMIGLMMTGYAVDSHTWTGKTVSGMLGGKLFLRVGGCERKQTECHLSKVRSCYGCFYFRPFRTIKTHQKVLEVLTKELIDLVEVSTQSGNANNPLIDTATDTKQEVEMVINRLTGGLS